MVETRGVRDRRTRRKSSHLIMPVVIHGGRGPEAVRPELGRSRRDTLETAMLQWRMEDCCGERARTWLETRGGEECWPVYMDWRGEMGRLVMHESSSYRGVS